jgi:tRNA A37 threonylcarbamoyladenosine dehydratase
MSYPAAKSFLAGATCVLLVRWLFDRRRRGASESSDPSHQTSSSSPKTVPEALRREQLSRHELYFGTEGMESIEGARVCVVGLGGVGSHCALMLARGGVGFLRLIDFDQVTLSSLNRHACATLQDVGIPKVEAVKSTCLELGLEASKVEALNEMYTAESGPGLLKLPSGQQWDIIIDCIDDVPTKAALLARCVATSTRVLSCMGAGGKSDMTRLHVSDLRTASRDPLASKLRQTIKKTVKKLQQQQPKENESIDDDSYLDDADKLTIIYSSEKTVAKLADLTDEQKQEADKSQFGAVDGMRIRVLPVLGPMPAIMGQSLASIALCELGKKPIKNPLAGERVGRNVRHKVLQQYSTREQKITKGALTIHGGASHTGPIAIDGDDVEYLYGIWRNKCAITGAKIGAVMGLVRWDTSKPATSDNLVLVSRPAMKALDEKGKESIDLFVRTRIEHRLAACRDANCDW